jgi:universal stress protein family protein
VAGTILCAVNDSAGSHNAARVAGALSKRLELRLVLVHVADAFTLADGSAGNDESVTTIQARSGGKRLLDQLTAEQGLRRAEQRIESATLPSGSPRSPWRNEQRLSSWVRARRGAVGGRHCGAISRESSHT